MLRHADQIRSQISKNEDIRKQDRLDYLEEGKRTRDKIDEDRQKILRIKAEKLTQMEKFKIPEKYTIELKSKKVSF